MASENGRYDVDWIDREKLFEIFDSESSIAEDGRTYHVTRSELMEDILNRLDRIEKHLFGAI